MTVLNPETKLPMTKEELNLIYQAMTMDLSKHFNWSQIADERKSEITETLEQQRFWNEISEVRKEAITNKLNGEFEWKYILDAFSRAMRQKLSNDVDVNLVSNMLESELMTDWDDMFEKSKIQQNMEKIASTICYVGQPVKISQDVGVIRLALDSESLRQVCRDIQNGTFDTLNDDMVIIRKLNFLAKNYGQLKEIMKLTVSNDFSFAKNSLKEAFVEDEDGVMTAKIPKEEY